MRERVMSPAEAGRSRPSQPAERDAPLEIVGWRYGAVAGLLGAAVVATLLLFVDLTAGRPLWTPAALGAALFAGERLSPASFEPWQHMALIVGYTAVHGAIYLGFGSLVAFFLLTARRLPRTAALAALIAGILFVLFEVSFLVQAELFAPGLADDLAAGWVGVANACAAAAMGVYVAHAARPRKTRVQSDAPAA